MLVPEARNRAAPRRAGPVNLRRARWHLALRLAKPVRNAVRNSTRVIELRAGLDESQKVVTPYQALELAARNDGHLINLVVFHKLDHLLQIRIGLYPPHSVEWPHCLCYSRRGPI